MKDTDLLIYYQQAFNFLQSMTIKFSPISDIYNSNIEAAGGIVDVTDETTWKYYLNLSGQYHPTDTMMTIQSLDTHQTINFTKANLAVHPRTAEVYIVGSSYYNDLVARYPSQVDLIKSIVYPVTDINKAIAAEDFTILSYGSGFLESNELDVILFDLEAFINYAVTRWYQPYMAYEEYYNWSFWGFLWQNLFLTIMASRVRYTKTAYANSFHVWQYLASKGIGDYKDVLTTEQALWLYRNIDYVKANRGKQDNLRLLADNLLNTVGVGLVGKTIYHKTTDNPENAKWTPVIVSQTVPTDTAAWIELIAPESITDFTFELFNNGLDVSTDPGYIQIQTDKLTNTTTNILPTKMLEIQQIGIDKKYAEILNNFIMDTLVYTITQQIYQPTIDFDDPVTGTHIYLSGKEALILLYYITYKSIGQTPSEIPTVYRSVSAYKRNISTATVPEAFFYYGVSHLTNSVLPVSDMISSLTYPANPITANGDFDNLVGTLFSTMIGHIKFSRQNDDLTTSKALELLYQSITVREFIPLTLDSTHTHYADWLEDSAHDYAPMFQRYDSSSTVQADYQNLLTLVMKALIPLQNSTIQQYIDNTDDVASRYNKIKNLFSQNCSYNINFLDTSRDIVRWFMLNKTGFTGDRKAKTYPLSVDISEAIAQPKSQVTRKVSYDEWNVNGSTITNRPTRRISYDLISLNHIKRSGIQRISYSERTVPLVTTAAKQKSIQVDLSTVIKITTA